MKAGLAAFCFLVSFPCLSQNIGIPDIINYSKKSYNAGTQNWDMVQDKNGILYFANNEGLLSFDGIDWELYPLPNRTSVRALAVAKDNRIYAGGQNEIGYFFPDAKGKLSYTSLKQLLPVENQSFTDVWDIVARDSEVFFKTKTRIFQLSNNTITVYTSDSEWMFMGLSNDQLIAQDQKNGLLHFRNNVWAPFIQESEMPVAYLVTSIIPLGKDSSLISTLEQGLFVLHNNKISRFRISGTNPFLQQRILSATPVTPEGVAVGTHLGGCYIINKKGELIQNFSREEGLQNNNIVSLFLDRNSNLWLGLDNGIDFIAYNDAVKHVYPDNLNEGAGYSSLIFNKELFIGTSNGLYKMPLSDTNDISFSTQRFQPVLKIKGPAWGLFEVNGNLLLGHHEGAFQIKDGVAYPITNRTGYWNFLPFSTTLPSSLIVSGNYYGLDFFEYKNNTFISKGNLPDFHESARYLSMDNNHAIWTAHSYKGVFKIVLDESLVPRIKLYTEKEGLPSLIKNQLYKIKSRIVIATERGIYEYNPKTDRFEASAFFERFFGEKNIRHLKEDEEGNIWFIEEQTLGVVDLTGVQPKIIYFPELNGKLVSGFEHIYPYNKYNILVGADKGLYHINYNKYRNKGNELHVTIRSVRAIGETDSLLFGGHYAGNTETTATKKDIPRIDNSWNSFHFEYSAPLYERQSNVEYSYYLEGFDNGWSAWSKKPEKEYTNLPASHFSFKVKARNNLGDESKVSLYAFTVLPPWYQTRLAYTLYALAFAGLLYFLYAWQKRKFRRQQEQHEEEQKRLQYLHQLELQKSEKEIMTLKNEKLQAEIEYKNTELASVAMHLVQKGELLAKIKEELVRLNKGLNKENTYNDLKRLIRILNGEDKMDKDWEQFAIHFDKVHSDFLNTLKEKYPNLSANELKLCAYLRMNLSSKEIAQLMNISVRGVEISRYRLRKKFQLPTEINLFNFLIEIGSAKAEI